MLPDADHQPATISEPIVGVGIALDVGEDLGPSKFLVRLWPGAVFRTTMPEATIHEDGNLGASENDIRSSGGIVQWLGVDQVSKPNCMQ